jgi:hypothetical protein
MDSILLENLKKLKKIQPDPGYSGKSRLFILSQRRTGVVSARSRGEKQTFVEVFGALKNFYSVKWATVAAVLLVVFLVSGGAYLYTKQSNQSELVVRAGEMNASIKVKLDEIKYLLEHSPTINQGDLPAIQSLLGEATTDLKEASALSADNAKLEESLQKIKSAQDALLKIDAMIKIPQN